ncbi:hypothetical protein ACHAPU_009344 [Fusarium lateritium]
MDTIDGGKTPPFIQALKDSEQVTAKALKRQGQLVNDHPPASTIVTKFLAKLLGKSILTPSSSPFGDMVGKILGSSHPFPNGKIIDNHFKDIPVTLVQKPYPPCIVPERDLKPMKISEMRLETHHRGAKVLLHVISPVDRNESVMAIVEDEAGTAVLLQLYQQPDEKLILCAANIFNYTVCIIKEPFFKQSFDTPFGGPLMTQLAYYSLRIDHPSDIICLHDGDERIPEKWKEEVRRQNSSEGCREEGDECFRNKQWVLAQRSYSRALDTAQTPEEERLAYLNRSLANLKLGRPERALLDTTQVHDPAGPPDEAFLRHARILYELGKFEQYEKTFGSLLERFPDSQIVKEALKHVKSRLQEQNPGDYNFRKMYSQAKETPPLIDCATFSKNVEVRDSPGRGRGLFTTKSVSAGDLLLCEKAFSYSFIDETRLEDRATCMLNLSTKQITLGASADLWPQLVQRLYHDPESLSVFQELYHGNYDKTTVSECDGTAVVDSFMVETIMSLNAFGCPRTSRDFCKENVWSGKETHSTREHPMFTTAGIWLIASRINHSCIGNCRRSFIGDMQIIRAARDMPAGEELLFPYRPSTASESYQSVQKHLKDKWGFICACDLCRDRSKTTNAVLKQRKKLHDDFMEQMPSDKPLDFTRAIQLMRGVEKTYKGKPAKQVRWVLAELYAYVGIRCRQDGSFIEATEMLIKALEALGFVIYFTPPGEATAKPRFEVKHWGMMEHCVPWLFFQLIECYNEVNLELLAAAQHYAELAYSIIIGEKGSMWDVMPSTGCKE